jgi:hypothetical protein
MLSLAPSARLVAVLASFGALELGCSCGRSVPADAAVPDAPIADTPTVDAADAGPDTPAA